LAVAVDIKVEQLRQYEDGESAVWASCLWALATALDVPVDYFFDGLIATPPPQFRVGAMHTRPHGKGIAHP
jgi:transcriptional regulator with XRE-family HTH domain